MLEADVRTLAETRTKTLDELVAAQQDLKDALVSQAFMLYGEEVLL